MLPVGLEPTASELEVRRAAIAPRELLIGVEKNEKFQMSENQETCKNN